MQLSNKILASFLIVFIISIFYGTTLVLDEIDKITGAGLIEQSQVSVTVAGTCGDGSISGSEACDGINLNGSSCVTLGYDAGTLACNSNCTFADALCVDVSGETKGGGQSRSETIRERAAFVVEHPTFNADALDSFDFAETKAQYTTFIIFKKQTYTVHITDMEVDFVTMKLDFPGLFKESLLTNFNIGDKRFFDLDGDGILDLEFTLKEILNWRAMFYVEKIKKVQSEIPYITSFRAPKFEFPKSIIEDYEYNTSVLLLLAVVILAIFNFAIFKRFLYK